MKCVRDCSAQAFLGACELAGLDVEVASAIVSNPGRKFATEIIAIFQLVKACERKLPMGQNRQQLVQDALKEVGTVKVPSSLKRHCHKVAGTVYRGSDAGSEVGDAVVSIVA